jgi:hypothetical protein
LLQPGPAASLGTARITASPRREEKRLKRSNRKHLTPAQTLFEPTLLIMPSARPTPVPIRYLIGRGKRMRSRATF